MAVTTVSSSRSAGRRYARGPARMTTSMEGSMGRSRSLAISRRRRFNVFRSTAVCRCFGTITPMRGWPRGEATARTSRCSVRIRLPSRATLDRSFPCVNRRVRGKPNCLSAAVLRRQLDRQPLAPLLAATAQHFTSPPRGHARTESMRADPALVAGTVRWLSHDSLILVSQWP